MFSLKIKKKRQDCRSLKRLLFPNRAMRRTVVDPKKARTDTAKQHMNVHKPGGGMKSAQGYNQALKSFCCPLCLAPGSLQITLSTSNGKGLAVFQCAECKREGRTGVGNIQFPYKMSFAPKLQKKVDMFFKFRDYVTESGLRGAAAAANRKKDDDNAQHDDRSSGANGGLLHGSLLGDALHNNDVSDAAPTPVTTTGGEDGADEGSDDDMDGLFGDDDADDDAV